jgi:hypothetical protein
MELQRWSTSEHRKEHAWEDGSRKIERGGGILAI